MDDDAILDYLRALIRCGEVGPAVALTCETAASLGFTVEVV